MNFNFAAYKHLYIAHVRTRGRTVLGKSRWKIGTSRYPLKRMKKLEADHGCKHDLFYVSYLTPDPGHKEALVHRWIDAHGGNHQLHGMSEYFWLSDQEVYSLKSLLNSFIGSCGSLYLPNRVLKDFTVQAKQAHKEVHVFEYQSRKRSFVGFFDGRVSIEDEMGRALPDPELRYAAVIRP